jgi:hypothetical protein
MIYEKRETSCWPLLNSDQHTVLTELKRLFVELKFPEANS